MGGKQTLGCYHMPMNEVGAFRRRFSALAGASAMAAVILMVVAVTYPSATLAVVLTAFPALGIGIWTLKCPHCANRLVRHGASDIEWRRMSKWWSEPSRCKRCGNEL
jgi:hypothetical protein